MTSEKKREGGRVKFSRILLALLAVLALSVFAWNRYLVMRADGLRASLSGTVVFNPPNMTGNLVEVRLPEATRMERPLSIDSKDELHLSWLLDLSPADGRLVAIAAGRDRADRVLVVVKDTGRVVFESDGYSTCGAISPNGKRLAWIKEKALWVSDIESSAKPKSITPGREWSHCSWRPDGNAIVACAGDAWNYGNCALLDPNTGEELEDFGNGIEARFSPDQSSIAIVTSGDACEVRDAFTGRRSRVLHDQAGINQIRWSPDGHSLGYIDDGRPIFIAMTRPPMINVFDIHTGWRTSLKATAIPGHWPFLVTYSINSWAWLK